MSTQHPLSQDEFDSIYSKVPRLTVEVIVKNQVGEIYLTKRAIEPCKGQWHLPGGTVRFGEPLLTAVKRIANRELTINTKEVRLVGYIEYPSHYTNSLDSPVGIAFEVMSYEGSVDTNDEASESGWFSKVPKMMHADQDDFLIKNHYLKG
jgi:ADP-ribose pyrophosphatase YjhB (NUDIX family)